MRLTYHPEVENIVEREVIVLRDTDPEIRLEVRSLPATFSDETESELPTPQPPRKGFAKDEKGRLIRSDSGHPVPDYDWDDPDYLEKKREIAKLQTTRTLVHGLMPGHIEFDADPDILTPPQFYRAVLEELADFGFGMGDLLKMVKTIGNLSGLTDDDIEKAELGFSEEEALASDS